MTSFKHMTTLIGLSFLSGCSVLQNSDLKEYEEKMSVLSVACPQCEFITRDIVNMKLDRCGGQYMDTFIETTESNTVFASLLALNKVNPKGYKAYVSAAQQSISCKSLEVWGQNFSNYLQTEEWENYYFQVMAKQNELTSSEDTHR